MVNLKNLAFWIMIIIVIGLAIYLIYFINTQSYQCLTSPLTFGVSKFKTSSGEFVCTCSSPNSESYLFVTKNNITEYNYKDNYFGVTTPLK